MGDAVPETQLQPRAPRCELILKVDYETLGQLRTDYLNSLGAGGLFLRSPLPLAIGQQLQMSISFPGMAPLLVRGEVRWTSADPNHEPGSGVAFTEMDAATRERLQAILERAREPVSPVQPRRLRAVMLQANTVLRDIFRFQMERFARTSHEKHIWDLDLVSTDSPDTLPALLSEKPTQLLILDFETQRVPPVDLLARLRAETSSKELPIIVLGDSQGMPADPRTMYVRKPFSVKPLFQTLRLLLET